MIERVMEGLNITDPKQVNKEGNTPSELEAGKRAQCAYSLGVTNGTHTKEQLAQYPNDRFIESIDEVLAYATPMKVEE